MLDNNREVIVNSLNELLESPNIRPYLFRTRFERNMLRILKYADEIGNTTLSETASKSLNKFKFITDKSNTTSCGMLRSYLLLEKDIRQILELV